MSTAGYLATVKRQGTSTAFTNEATTELTANTVFQITNTAKQVCDPTVEPTVEVDDGGGYDVADSDTYDWDSLSGTVTFHSALGASDTVRISGSYLPMLEVAEAKSYSIQLSCNMLAADVLNSDGARRRVGGSFDVSISLSNLQLLTEDQDPGGDEASFEADLTGRLPLLIEIQSSPSAPKFRAWVLAESAGTEGDPDSLIETSLSFQGAAQKHFARPEWGAWGWCT